MYRAEAARGRGVYHAAIAGRAEKARYSDEMYYVSMCGRGEMTALRRNRADVAFDKVSTIERCTSCENIVAKRS